VGHASDTSAFVDYYELLQVSPNADEETIQRIFRHFAKKYHPDGGSSQGDSERFNKLLEAYRNLTDPALRGAYDAAYQAHWDQTWKVGAEASQGNVISDDARVRERLLSLFYIQRRRDMKNPGMGQIELERLMDIPFDHLAFHLWYLREKGWVQRLDNGQLAITADGVDKAERYRSPLDPERLIESRVAGDARAELASKSSAS
jgi:curved DNA-binding protein CbpA